MKRQIVVDINSETTLLEKYNNEKISKELINYIIAEGLKIKARDKIKIVINNNAHIEKDILQMMIDGLDEEYIRSKKKYKINKIKQILFFIFGFTFVFLSTLVKEVFIWKEILLITGWVPMWEIVEFQLFSNPNDRKRIWIITKLLDSEIEVRNIGV